MSTTTRLSVAALRRTLVPGTKLRVINHVRAGADRETSVHPATNTVDLVVWGASIHTGKQVGMHIGWPKAADLRGDADGSIHIDRHGAPLVTLTIVRDDDPAAADWPETSRPLAPSAPA